MTAANVLKSPVTHSGDSPNEHVTKNASAMCSITTKVNYQIKSLCELFEEERSRSDPFGPLLLGLERGAGAGARV